MARVAAQRGAEVTLVSAHTVPLAEPAGVRIVNVGTALELRDAVRAAAADADVVVMAAAVADFRPTTLAEHKIKKSDAEPDAVELVRNPDVLAELVRNRREDQILVGFAAETGDEHGDVLTYARAKLKRKGCDLLVVNAVGDGHAFEVDDNQGWLLTADGVETPIPLGSKAQLAAAMWDQIASIR